jgi:type II secretory pathway pseudopilin PulG
MSLKNSLLKTKGLTLLELAIVFIIISIFIATLISFIYQAAANAKEVSLRYTLKNLRLSIDLYKIIYAKYPQDLRILIDTGYRAFGSSDVIFGKNFLENALRDKEGYPLDPFGNKFYYNYLKGVVRTTTAGYENW